MILLDLGHKRSETKNAWKANINLLILCTLKDFRETARSIIAISLADKGLEIAKEGMVIYS